MISRTRTKSCSGFSWTVNRESGFGSGISLNLCLENQHYVVTARHSEEISACLLPHTAYASLQTPWSSSVALTEERIQRMLIDSNPWRPDARCLQLFKDTDYQTWLDRSSIAQPSVPMPSALSLSSISLNSNMNDGSHAHSPAGNTSECIVRNIAPCQKLQKHFYGSPRASRPSTHCFDVLRTRLCSVWKFSLC